jgi:ubiquitin C-terminal hydrolase
MAFLSKFGGGPGAAPRAAGGALAAAGSGGAPPTAPSSPSKYASSFAAIRVAAAPAAGAGARSAAPPLRGAAAAAPFSRVSGGISGTAASQLPSGIRPPSASRPRSGEAAAGAAAGYGAGYGAAVAASLGQPGPPPRAAAGHGAALAASLGQPGAPRATVAAAPPRAAAAAPSSSATATAPPPPRAAALAPPPAAPAEAPLSATSQLQLPPLQPRAPDGAGAAFYGSGALPVRVVPSAAAPAAPSHPLPSAPPPRPPPSPLRMPAPHEAVALASERSEASYHEDDQPPSIKMGGWREQRAAAASAGAGDSAPASARSAFSSGSAYGGGGGGYGGGFGGGYSSGGASASGSRASSAGLPPPSLGGGGSFEAAGTSTAGLDNLGNTCYLNSTLQCLAHVPELAAYFRGETWRRDLGRSAGAGTVRGKQYRELTERFAALLEALAHAGRGSVRPSAVRSLVGAALSGSGMFAGPAQNDAHELLRFFLDALGEALNRVPGKPPYRELTETPSQSDEEVAAIYWAYYHDRGNSVVTDLFRGQQRSVITCASCGTASRAFDPFEELLLPIPRGAQVSGSFHLRESFADFARPDTLSAENEWKCPACKRPRSATKELTVYRAPRVLVLVLKRFSFNWMRRGKVEAAVVAPEAGLTLGACAAPGSSAECAVYDLIGVVNHMGSTVGGHYTANCRVGDAAWWNFNDSSAHITTAPGSAARSEPYVLFYRKRPGT